VSRKSESKSLTRSGSMHLVPKGPVAPAEFGAGHAAQLSRSRLHTIVIASGRGGVGKSNLAVNLAICLAQRGARVVLVDGDIAQANLDLLLGVHPRWDLGDVLAGEKTLEEVVVQGPAGVRLVPGAAGRPELADLDDYRRELLLRSLGLADERADLMIVDTASGLSRQTLELCRAAHELVVVVTPEMVSCSDAYGLMKTLGQENALARSPRLVVNLANTPEEAEEVTNRMRMFARHFLRLELDALGLVPYDPCVPRAVRAQEPVSLLLPQSPAAIAYRALAARLWKPVPTPSDSEIQSGAPHRLEA